MARDGGLQLGELTVHRRGLAKMGRSGVGMWPGTSQPVADTQERGCYGENESLCIGA